MLRFREIYLGLKLSFSYFSTIPVKFGRDERVDSDGVLNSMLFFLPFVGGVISLLTLKLYDEVERFGWYGAFLASLAYPLFYGFLHLEAVMDVVDALFARHSGKEPYGVIKEPTVGAMGVLYTTALMLFKIVSILYLLLDNRGLFLVVVAVSSRLSLLLLFLTFKFRSKFLSRLKGAFSKSSFFLALIIYVSLIYLLVGVGGAIVTLLTLLLSILLGRILYRKLGFANGDFMGTILELIETFLISTAIFLF
jgi:adenosylcobinamide-GDP ribazoletransferase